MSGTKQIYCTSCELYIKGQEEYKAHFQSDFHKYNCKRKLVSLTPLSLEDFETKKARKRVVRIIEVLNLSNSEVSEDSTYTCNVCRQFRRLILSKSFSHHSQYKQHLQSKKHAKQVKSGKTASTTGGPKKEYTEGKPKTTLDSNNVCLFCNSESDSLELNLDHMQEKHSFILPYSDVLKDKATVLHYLAEKIHIGNICLGCNNYRTGGFKNGQAVQQHMQDKGHTFLELDIFQEEYANFVKHKDQFLRKRQPMTGRISGVMSMKEIEEMKHAEEEGEKASETSSEFMKVSSEDSREVLSMHSSSSVETPAKEVPAKAEKKEAGEDWEDIELHDVEDSGEHAKQPELLKEASLSVSEISSVSAASTVDEHIMVDTGELLLSNGKLIGHRMYNYIYKQRLPMHDNRASVAAGLEHAEALKNKLNAKKAQARAKNDVRAREASVPYAYHIQ